MTPSSSGAYITAAGEERRYCGYVCPGYLSGSCPNGRRVPEEWLRRERLRLARQLLETTDQPIERVAGMAGFPSPSAMRAQFAARLMVSPRAYRRTFRQ